MSIGTGIVLFVIGAVLTFALDLQLDWIDLDLVGYLLMGAGVVVFVIGMVFMMRKRKSVTTMHTDQPGGSSTTERRTSVTPDEMP